MATITQSLVYDCSTLANFLAVFKTGLSDVLVTAGWRRTSDTGQINWTTWLGSGVLPATDATTYYELFQTPADGLTSYYVKLNYSRTASGRPELYVQIGTGTDGAGNLTGAGTQFKSESTSGSTGGASTPYEYRACYDASSVAILMARDFAGCFLCLERSRDSTGAYTSSYLTAFSHGCQSAGSGRKFQQSATAGSGVGTVLTEYASLVQTGTNTAAGATATGFFPVFPCIPYADYPSLFVAQMGNSDIGEAATIAPTMYGAAHTFLSFGLGNAGIGQGKTAGSSCKTLMRWE